MDEYLALIAAYIARNGIYRTQCHISRAVSLYRACWLEAFWLSIGCFYELMVNEFRKLLLKHYHKLPLSHIEHDTKSHFNHPLPKHPKTDFFNNLMSYTSQAWREGISNFCENFEQFSEYTSKISIEIYSVGNLRRRSKQIFIYLSSVGYSEFWGNLQKFQISIEKYYFWISTF